MKNNNKTINQLTKTSRFLCLVLRHKPSAANVVIDTNGWTKTSTLLKNMKNTKNELSVEELNQLIKDDDKGRYSTKGHGQYIRCNQGHYLPYVDIKFDLFTPESDVYHGTNPDLIDIIMKEGLTPQSRNYVHLSKDLETARTVGKRHSKKKEPVIFVINKDADVTLYITENNVLQSRYVPPEFISILK